MVFYGRKTSSHQRNTEQYRSIREQILRELGQRITPVQQKSIATILWNAGQIILIATQSVLSVPQYLRSTVLYQKYQLDRQQFKSEMQPQILRYHQLANHITENKFYMIKNFTCPERIFALNGSLFLLALLSLRTNKGLPSKIRGLMKTCIVGYPVGGLFLVPQIYNSVLSHKFV